MGQGFNSSFNVVKLSFANEEKLLSAILRMNPLTFRRLDSLRSSAAPISPIQAVGEYVIEA